ncbi:hypothetical protein [Novosphingobium sp.]|uniref:hypothetical protein n=1 Tax=Novosphingobium sp. TaxID=1874826 RepID=UPI002FDE0E6A
MKLSQANRDRILNLSGPLIFSGSGFFASFLVQRASSLHDFGVFAFVQVVLATGMALSNGLVTVPAASQIAQGGLFDDVERVFVPTVWGISLMGSLMLIPVIWSAGASSGVLVASALLALATWSRYAFRALALVGQQRKEARNSDVAYGLVYCLLLVGAAIIRLESIVWFLTLQIFASILSGIPIRQVWLRLPNFSRDCYISYVARFKRTGAGSLLSSIFGQISSSSHAYLTTLFLSPAAFAPIALATLTFRPLGVVLTGVMQFETPRIAASLRDQSDQSSIIKLLRDLFFIMAIVWVLNCLLAFPIAYWSDRLFASRGYEASQVRIAIFLMAILVFFRALREPHTALLAVSGANLHLAKFSGICSVLTLSLVIIFALTFKNNSPLTILGPVIGEIVNFLAVLSLSRRRFASAVS